MNISPEIEKLVRQLLALGVAVVIVITAQGGADDTGTSGAAQTIVLTPGGTLPSSGVEEPCVLLDPSESASPSPDPGDIGGTGVTGGTGDIGSVDGPLSGG